MITEKQYPIVTEVTIDEVIEQVHLLHAELSDMVDEYLELVDGVDEEGIITDEYVIGILSRIDMLTKSLECLKRKQEVANGN